MCFLTICWRWAVARLLPNALGSGQAAAWPLPIAVGSDISTSQRDNYVRVGQYYMHCPTWRMCVGQCAHHLNDRWAVVIQ